jgi:hypothetical protein
MSQRRNEERHMLSALHSYLHVYSPLRLTMPRVPLRSRLYHLEPLGTGAWSVESMTSYLTRLAEEHHVKPGILVREEMTPWIAHLAFPYGTATRWLQGVGYTMNGHGKVATACVEALEELTRQSPLLTLTMGHWAQLVSGKALVQKYQSWCPACWEGWRREGSPLYLPLLWTLHVVSRCPVHHIPLRQRCPHATCGNRVPMISSRSRLGYCPMCQRPLTDDALSTTIPISGLAPKRQKLGWGTSADHPIRVDSDKQTEQEAIAVLAGQLLAGVSAETVSLVSRIPEVMTRAVSAIADGSKRAFVRRLGIERTTLLVWLRQTHRPTLLYLLVICRMAGRNGEALLIKEQAPREHETQVEDMEEGVAAPGRAVILLRDTMPPRHRTSVPARTQLRLSIEPRLWEYANAGADAPTRSLYSIARELACPESALRRWYPDWCHTISKRFLQERRQRSQRIRAEQGKAILSAVRELEAQGTYPSVAQIVAILERQGVRAYVRDGRFIEARREALRTCGWIRNPTTSRWTKSNG